MPCFALLHDREELLAGVGERALGLAIGADANVGDAAPRASTCRGSRRRLVDRQALR
jgi:hypothetical protein